MLERILYGAEKRRSKRRVTTARAHTPMRPIVTAVALPNLHRFVYCGVRTYWEAIVHRTAAIATLRKVTSLYQKRDVLTF